MTSSGHPSQCLARLAAAGRGGARLTLSSGAVDGSRHGGGVAGQVCCCGWSSSSHPAPAAAHVGGPSRMVEAPRGGPGRLGHLAPLSSLDPRACAGCCLLSLVWSLRCYHAAVIDTLPRKLELSRQRTKQEHTAAATALPHAHTPSGSTEPQHSTPTQAACGALPSRQPHAPAALAPATAARTRSSRRRARPQPWRPGAARACQRPQAREPHAAAHAGRRHTSCASCSRMRPPCSACRSGGAHGTRSSAARSNAPACSLLQTTHTPRVRAAVSALAAGDAFSGLAWSLRASARARSDGRAPLACRSGRGARRGSTPPPPAARQSRAGSGARQARLPRPRRRCR